MESPAGVQKTKEVGPKKKKLVRLEGRARKTCFERRRKGLQKKASQLGSLCGLRIALVIKDIDDAPDMHTWPPNLDEVQRTVVSYQHRAFDVKAGNTTGKKKMQVDTRNFASLGSKKNHQGRGKGVQHCGCHLDDLDSLYTRKLDSINHRIGVIMMATHTDSLQVTSVPFGSRSVDCCELDESDTDLSPPTACCTAGIVAYNAAWGDDIIPDNLNGDISATQLMNPLAEATTFYSCTDLGPPAACSPTGIVAYNAAWGDDAILDDLNGNINVTQLMNPLAEAEATTFWSDFGSCSATGSNCMDDSCTDLGPPAACSPTGIMAYNAAWGDDAITDYLNGDINVTQLMNPLAEAEATTFWFNFGSCSATGSNCMDDSCTDLGPPAACSPTGIVAYNAAAWGDDAITDDLNGDINVTQLMNPLAEAEATTFWSDFGSCSATCSNYMDDSCTDLDPPAACSPTGIVSYNAAWGDDAILDDLNGDTNVTQLMNPLAEAEATTFWSDFGSCSATGSNYMELGPEEDFYQWHSSDITEMEEDDLFLRPFSPSSLFDPSAMFHNTAMLPQSYSIDC